MLFLGQKGYRVIAHDRRGHGRSSQPWNGNTRDNHDEGRSAALEPRPCPARHAHLFEGKPINVAARGGNRSGRGPTQP